MHQSDTLVRMANQIAKFFAIQGEERAVAGIEDHIKKFWEPRMKVAIFAHIDAGGKGLEPVVLKALLRLRKSTTPEGAVAPAAKAGAAPQPAQKNGKDRKNGNGQRGKAAAR